MRKNLNLRSIIVPGLIFAFLVNSFGPLPLAQAQEFFLPAPGVMVHLSTEFNPPILKGIRIHPDNPFRFDFILDQGDNSLPLVGSSAALGQTGHQICKSIGTVREGDLKQDATKLIKYFLASLTIPEKDLWVNLSPYEKNRVIPQSFGLTEMGRDLLAEDYMLKQITASLIYPEDEIGKKFWKRIYQEAAKRFGTTNVPVNTFNKVWIVPEKAVVYENVKTGTAYIVESKLKVMLEQDYLAFSKNNFYHSLPLAGRVREGGDINALGSQIIREIVIPKLTKEVNENKNFAQLRQVYNSLILATWYKKKIKDSILEQVYADKNKVGGVEYDKSVILSAAKDLNKINSIRDSSATPQNDVDVIYQCYLKAFKKGVYNYIKEEPDPITQQTIGRKYFSGGMDLALNVTNLGATTELQTVNHIDPAQLNQNNLEVVSSQMDKAMTDQADQRRVKPNLKALSIHDLLSKESISESLRTRILNALGENGIETTAELTALTPRQRYKIPKIGPDSWQVLRRAMQKRDQYLVGEIPIGYYSVEGMAKKDPQKISVYDFLANEKVALGSGRPYSYYVRIWNAMEYNNINTVAELLRLTPKEFLSIIPNYYKDDTFNKIREILRNYGWYLKGDKPRSKLKTTKSTNDTVRVPQGNVPDLAMAVVNPVDDMAMGSRVKIDPELQRVAGEIYDIYNSLIRKNGSSLKVSKEKMLKSIKMVTKFPSKTQQILVASTMMAIGGLEMIVSYNNNDYPGMIASIVMISIWGGVLYPIYSIRGRYTAATYSPFTRKIKLRADWDHLSFLYNLYRLYHRLAHEMAHMFRLPKDNLLANAYSRLIMIKMGYESDQNIQVRKMADFQWLKEENKGFMVASIVSSIVAGNLKEKEVVIRKFWKQYRKYKDGDDLADIIRKVKTNIERSDYRFPKARLFEEGWSYPYGETMGWLAIMHYQNVDDALQFIYNLGKLGDVELAVKAVDRAQINPNGLINSRNDKGGIDLTPANMHFRTQNNGREIRFHIDPAMLQQLQNAPGFVPVIINIQPLKSLTNFLGINNQLQSQVNLVN